MSPPVARKSRRGLYILLAALLIMAIIGSLVASYFFFFQRPIPPTSSLVGQAFFVSSGQLSKNGAQGIADQIKIDLQNIPDPAAGKSYHLWLLGDKTPFTTQDLVEPAPIQVPMLLTNNLSVKNGVVHFIYEGDSLHNNLLSVGSRLLVTLENANNIASSPPTDRQTWRYYAELPQTPIPLDNNHFNALVHIRHLFYNEVDIKVLGLPGGLDSWFFRNTEKLFEWSVSARDDWNGTNTTPTQVNLMRNQFIRILDYMDGTANVHIDVPANTPILADQTIAKVAMLTVDPQHQGGANNPTNPLGYVDHTQFHVSQISKATDLTPQTRATAVRIITAINNAKIWLLNAHKDAVALFNMTPDQLLQPAAGALVDDLVTQITYAYIGQLDPVTNKVHPGVLQMHYDIQQLGTFTLSSNIPNHL